ncbi:uncharacterized protein SETTUDRAFT_118945, partial [Exserohilum turcica Et28A]
MPASDIRLFVTNLRLLDFGQRQDWPDITVQTFSAKNADQRQRIAGTEWALFRLFEIWDPNETAQKLQPFFPPLEPLQSLNLRAALFRCLNDLKKNGVLGREAVLRKTMLDECKGDKFYEVMAIFSNAVLKKVLAARDGGARDAAVARRLATAPILSPDQQRSLLPLAIAHKAALLNVLKKKEEKRRKYLEFEGLLDKKAEDINSRIRKCKDTPRAKKPAVTQKEADVVKRQLKDNWIGNQKWLDVMLHGDGVQAEDAFLSSRFDKVWHMVENDRKLEDVAPETGLLENLQSRVREQQERLQKWKAFHDELQSDAAGTEKPANAKSAVPIQELKFDAHSQYQLPSSKEKVEDAAIKRPELRAEYRDILSDMETELSCAGTNKTGPISTIMPRRRTSPAKDTQSPVPRRKMTLSDSLPGSPTSPVVPPKPKHLSRPNSLHKVPTLSRPPQHVSAGSTPIDSEATLIGQSSTRRSTPPRPGHVASPVETRYENGLTRERTPPTSIRTNGTSNVDSPEPTVTLTVQKASPSPKRSPESPPKPLILTFAPPVFDAEEAMADQIIDSIGNATPSPVKKPQPRMSLSLLERTRMTMSHSTSFSPVAESPDPLPTMAPPPLPSASDDDTTTRHATLLERTRLSMTATQSLPRPKKPTQRKSSTSRQSLYPVNQLESPHPRDSTDHLDHENIDGTDQLFSDETDYDHVFKSRPRIATSPVWSPEGRRNSTDADEEYADDDDPDGVTGIDLADVDQDYDDDEEGGYRGSWVDSPSQKRG